MPNLVDIREYFDSSPYALDDALLKTYVTKDIVREASAFIESLAFSFGVAASQIAIPTPDPIRRLALYFAYFTTALRKASFSKGGDVDEDSFALKYKLYKDLFDELYKTISADTFTNGVSAKKRKFPATMEILRN